MSHRLLALSFLAVASLPAASKKTATARGENDDVVVTATVYTDRNDIKQLVGSDLDGHYYIADVKVEPKYGKEAVISRDDFLLRSLNDGDKSSPFVPSQITGKAAIILKRTEGGNGGAQTTPTYGGMPVPPMGGPVGYPSNGGALGSGGSGDYESVKATVNSGNTAEKDNPLEKTLAAKMLPEKKTDQPVSGLLYFVMEKVKLKDLELDYGGKENRISLRFNKKD